MVRDERGHTHALGAPPPPYSTLPTHIIISPLPLLDNQPAIMTATESGTKRKREDEEVEKKQEVVVENPTGDVEEEKKEDVKKEDVNNEDDESGSEYEEESDSDVEFVLAPNKGAAAPSTEQTQTAATQPAGQTPTTEGVTQGQPAQGTLDIDAEGTYNDQPISQVPITSYQDKPWRRPGIDLSDYFNYGFDEMSWIAYCNRQDKLRAQASMPGMMGDMGQASMVPPMPMMPMGQMPMGQMPNPPMGMPPFMMPPQMMFPPEQH